MTGKAVRENNPTDRKAVTFVDYGGISSFHWSLTAHFSRCDLTSFSVLSTFPAILSRIEPPVAVTYSRIASYGFLEAFLKKLSYPLLRWVAI